MAVQLTIPRSYAKHSFTSRQRKLLKLFWVVMLIAFSPYTPAGQVAPFVFLLGAIFVVNIRPMYHLKRYVQVFVLYCGAGLLYSLLYPRHFGVGSYFLFFITMSPYLILLFDFRPVVNESVLRRMGTITLLIVTFEAAYGIFQALHMFRLQRTFDRSAGDMVWGTLAPTFNWAYSGRMPIFAILISTLLLFALAASPRRLSLWHVGAFGTIALCWLLTSLMHSYIYFALAAVGAVFLSHRFSFAPYIKENAPRLRRKANYGVGLILLIIVLFVLIGPILLPENFGKIFFILKDAFDFGPHTKFIKNRVMYLTLFELPNDVGLQPLIGLGPGQFGSRAALMLSGEYLQRTPIPFIEPYANIFMQEYILSRLKIITSSIHFPTSSIIAWYGELGIAGVIFLGMVVWLGVQHFRTYRSDNFPRLNIAMLILIIYLLVMGFQNVYWEYTQAVFPALLGLKLCSDYLKVEHTKQR